MTSTKLGVVVIISLLFTSGFAFAMEMSTSSTQMVHPETGTMKKVDTMSTDAAMMKNEMQAHDENLAMGSRGAAVVELQKQLESKGYLVFPSHITRGYFGARTKMALMKYQTQLGVPATGYYGAMTRAKMKTLMTHDAMKKGDAMMEATQ